MTKFYAYKPRADGKLPLGTTGRTLFELKTVGGAKKRARSVLGSNYKLFTYTNFYNDKTFKKVR
jgi:hypothetical protein